MEDEEAYPLELGETMKDVESTKDSAQSGSKKKYMTLSYSFIPEDVSKTGKGMFLERNSKVYLTLPLTGSIKNEIKMSGMKSPESEVRYVLLFDKKNKKFILEKLSERFYQIQEVKRAVEGPPDKQPRIESVSSQKEESKVSKTARQTRKAPVERQHISEKAPRVKPEEHSIPQVSEKKPRAFLPEDETQSDDEEEEEEDTENDKTSHKGTDSDIGDDEDIMENLI